MFIFLSKTTGQRNINLALLLSLPIAFIALQWVVPYLYLILIGLNTGKYSSTAFVFNAENSHPNGFARTLHLVFLKF